MDPVLPEILPVYRTGPKILPGTGSLTCTDDSKQRKLKNGRPIGHFGRRGRIIEQKLHFFMSMTVDQTDKLQNVYHNQWNVKSQKFLEILYDIDGSTHQST